jgi:hypothetical protein
MSRYSPTFPVFQNSKMTSEPKPIEAMSETPSIRPELQSIEETIERSKQLMKDSLEITL